MIALAENSYGKSSVRVMKVKRDRPLHSVWEWKVEVLLSGDFESCFTDGDNSAILPTDTMKNTVYSRARESTAECIEDFALELAQFFLSRNPQVEQRRDQHRRHLLGACFGRRVSRILPPLFAARAKHKPRLLRVPRVAKPRSRRASKTWWC